MSFDKFTSSNDLKSSFDLHITDCHKSCLDTITCLNKGTCLPRGIISNSNSNKHYVTNKLGCYHDPALSKAIENNIWALK